MAAKFLHDAVDDRRLYSLTVTVYEGDDDVYQEGTLLELAQDWGLIKGLITLPNGELDHTMLEIPLEMDLTIGWAHYKLELING